MCIYPVLFVLAHIRLVTVTSGNWHLGVVSYLLHGGTGTKRLSQAPVFSVDSYNNQLNTAGHHGCFGMSHR